ncbi:MAG: hypothetical protein IBJ09_02400 [Bacteroidia bacterium]|nr:hypothetical protein [Bacteroidia bacterium]
MSLERKFSNVYAKIVQHELDIEGHVAYTLYKAAKINYIKEYQAESKRRPTEADLETFHKMAQTIIYAFRLQAQELLQTYAQLNLETMKRRVEKEVRAKQEETLKAIIRPLIPPSPKAPWDGFWMSVLVKSVQAAIMGLLLFFIVFGVSAKGDFWDAIRKLLPPAQETTTVTAPPESSQEDYSVINKAILPPTSSANDSDEAPVKVVTRRNEYSSYHI